MRTNRDPQPGLDILIVVWREIEALKSLEKTLTSQSFQNFRVLVALNDPNEEVEAALPQADNWLYFRGENEGYAGGLERLWREATSPWLLVSNTDLSFSEGTLEAFMKLSNEVDDDVGYIGPKILFDDGRLQCGGGLLLGPEGICRPRGFGLEDNTSFDHLSRVPILSGCCFLIRKKVIEEVNGFDPRFFMYMEDVHLFLKAVWAGWMGQYAPQIEIVHEHSGSLERYGELHLFQLERNHWWVSPQLPLMMVIKKPFYMIARWWILLTGKSRIIKKEAGSGHALVAIRAFLAGILGLPRQYFKPFLKKRSRREFNEIFKEHRIGFKDFMTK